MEKKIYLVGGAVRDMLLNVPNYDKDYVAVGYKEEDFSHLQKVGKEFPIFLMEDKSELALARSSGNIQNNKITIEEDLKNRDLTVNSMAYEEDTKTFIDPYNGKADIKKKILRHTSEAFKDDPLRVLRAARFKAMYGIEWKIHASTKVLIYNMKDDLKNLQSDRVYKEIKKVFALKNTHIFFETLFELGVLDAIFPSIYELTTLKENSIYHLEASVFEHTMMILKELQNESELLKATALYHDIAKPYSYRKFGNSSGHDELEIVEPLIDMHLPTKLRKKMLFIIANHIRIAKLEQMKKAKVAKFFESLRRDRDLLIDLLRFYDADNKGRITLHEKNDLDEKMLLDIFDEICSYSPKEWIIEQDEEPSVEVLKQHIHYENIRIVKKHMDH